MYFAKTFDPIRTNPWRLINQQIFHHRATGKDGFFEKKLGPKHEECHWYFRILIWEKLQVGVLFHICLEICVCSNAFMKIASYSVTKTGTLKANLWNLHLRHNKTYYVSVKKIFLFWELWKNIGFHVLQKFVWIFTDRGFNQVMVKIGPLK